MHEAVLGRAEAYAGTVVQLGTGGREQSARHGSTAVPGSAMVVRLDERSPQRRASQWCPVRPALPALLIGLNEWPGGGRR